MNPALARLIAGHVFLHACMAGMRMAAPLLALREGYSALAVGILLALFSLTQVFLAIPAGRYADRHGLLKPMGLGISAAMLGAALALLCALGAYLAPLQPNILALQFAFTPRAFGEVVHQWTGEPLHRYRVHLLVDYALLASYGLFGWYWLPHLPMVALFFISALAETNRPPFDLPEAESELVAGYQVEYSSTPFLLFMIGELMSVFFMCALISILFFGGWLSPIPGLPDGALWLFGKMIFFFFIFAMVKAIVPRYRYDQLMRIGWKVFLPLSLGWVVLVGLFAHYGWFWGAYQRWALGG